MSAPVQYCSCYSNLYKIVSVPLRLLSGSGPALDSFPHLSKSPAIVIPALPHPNTVPRGFQVTKNGLDPVDPAA
jgi:hypothetical protein